MDPERYSSLSIKTESASRVRVQLDQDIYPPYEIEIAVDPEASKTGHLELFRIIPKSNSIPTFSFRWDHNENSVNVDIHEVPDETRDSFKKEKFGFRGHKTIRREDGSYLFCIEVPGDGTIAKGSIRLIANFGLKVSD
ncbi:MAG: hypothetical protein LAO31_04370 [Acidobacteriia bacterium]|nr:hypothetical protein [Terriglobia bacterium]